jgi:16S rRNA (cytosine1402-N4)-methyltransferase
VNVEAHQPVLLQESLEGLNVKADGTYIDGTFGRGGHAQAILNKLGESGRLLALDRDPAAIKAAKSLPLYQDPRFAIEHAAFAELKNVVAKHKLMGKINGVLLDVGVSSPQLDNPERGFSFTKDGPLDMRMDLHQECDAATWLATAKTSDIAKVLKVFGEEKFAKRIAHAIVAEREQHPITRTKQLADLIAEAVPVKEKHKHPATRSFQAIRIFINQELEQLKSCLQQCLEVMSVGGRICAISFHSLEDGVVKKFFQHEARGGQYPPKLPIKAVEVNARLKIIKRLIKPSVEEIAHNPRARSARLRIAEKIT